MKKFTLNFNICKKRSNVKIIKSCGIHLTQMLQKAVIKNMYYLFIGYIFTFHPRFSKNVESLDWPVVLPPQGPAMPKR